MQRRVALLALLLGSVVFLQPVLGNGPGADTEYVYEPSTVEVNGTTEAPLYELSAVAYASGSVTEAVWTAAENGTYERPVSATPDAVVNLTRAAFVLDDPASQYYAVDAAVTDGRFRLTAEAVPVREVVGPLAVAPGQASAPIRDALDGAVQRPERAASTLVRDGDRYRLVVRTEAVQVSDPLTVPKLALYAVGVALLVGGLVGLRTGPE